MAGSLSGRLHCDGVVQLLLLKEIYPAMCDCSFLFVVACDRYQAMGPNRASCASVTPAQMDVLRAMSASGCWSVRGVYDGYDDVRSCTHGVTARKVLCFLGPSRHRNIALPNLYLHWG
jgi:hypothetical protein